MLIDRVWIFMITDHWKKYFDEESLLSPDASSFFI
jgi:hypothetical protein